MATFWLKKLDTRPILEVLLQDPDGTAHDLTGAITFKLHIRLKSGTIISRDMVLEGAPTAGTLRYTWLSTDWNVPGLVTGEHQMEYEVIGGSSRMTFPNDGYDELRVYTDLGTG